MVDKEVKKFPYIPEDVEDYWVVFNFSDCTLDYDLFDSIMGRYIESHQANCL
jgi:hypothetical protein